MPLEASAQVAEAATEYVHEQNTQDEPIQMPAPTAKEDLLDDYRYTGLTLGPHPMRVLRENATLTGYRTASELATYRQGQLIRIAGLVTGRQRPGTATGVVFLTLEDETGNTNVVVWSSILDRFRAALLQGQLLKIKGVVEREGAVIHVVAGHVEDATNLLRDMATDALPFKSRDFH
jgi:error-prone DNA polymerase